MYQGLSGSDCFASRMKLRALVGQIFREVVAILRPVRLVDKWVIFDEIRKPVAGLTPHKPVEPVVTLTQGPILLLLRPL
jgi:hypothetical protein